MQVWMMPIIVGFKNKFKNCDWIYQEKTPCMKIPYMTHLATALFLPTFVQFHPEMLCYSVMDFI